MMQSGIPIDYSTSLNDLYAYVTHHNSNDLHC